MSSADSADLSEDDLRHEPSIPEPEHLASQFDDAWM